jgi:DNA invertase Pin-like site-specific DNA recombinase
MRMAAHRSPRAATAAVLSAPQTRSSGLRSVIHDDEIADVRARPGLARALQRITAGEAHALVIGDIRRLTPALDDLGTLLEWFRDADARLVVPEVSIDTGTPEGAETAARLIRLSHWQREQEAESPATREEGPRPDGRTGAPS